MRRPILPLAVLLTGLGTGLASPAPAQSAPRIRISPTLDATVAWHSNVLLRDPAFAPAVSDWITVARPGLAAALGDGEAPLAGRLHAGVEWLRFGRFSAYDRSSPQADGTLRWAGARADLELHGTWQRTARPSPDFRRRRPCW